LLLVLLFAGGRGRLRRGPTAVARLKPSRSIFSRVFLLPPSLPFLPSLPHLCALCDLPLMRLVPEEFPVGPRVHDRAAVADFDDLRRQSFDEVPIGGQEEEST